MQPKHPTHTIRTQFYTIPFITLLCLVLIASALLSGCSKMGGLDYKKFDELMAKDAKKSKASRPKPFAKIRSQHISKNKPQKRYKSTREYREESSKEVWQESQSVDLSQSSFSYTEPMTNQSNAMLLNPFSSSSTFTLPQGLSPYYAEVIEDEMLPFPLERKKPARYKPTSHSELVSLVQNESIRLSEIDTSKITDMGFLFACNDAFLTCREDFRGIERWDTSKVVDMESMFDGNPFFNADISSWNVSKVRNMSKMFYNASKFNQSLSRWGDKIRRDTKKHGMFLGSKLESNPPRWYRR